MVGLISSNALIERDRAVQKIPDSFIRSLDTTELDCLNTPASESSVSIIPNESPDTQMITAPKPVKSLIE